MDGRVDPRRESLPAASPESPNLGAIEVSIDGESVILTNARHWVEEGEHVIASTDFQIAAAGESFLSAFEGMIDNLHAESHALMERVRDRETAINELEEAVLLAERFLRIEEMQERRQREVELAVAAGRRRTVNRGRRWVTPLSAQPTSGVSSLA